MTSRLRRRLTGIAAVLLGVGLLPAIPAAVAATDPVSAPELGRFEPLGTFELDDARARVTPSQFTAVAADVRGLRQDLASAPAADAVASDGAAITLPDPNGAPVKFAVSSVPVMEDELAAKFPQIQTYSGRQVDDSTRSVALEVTPTGFHAYVRDLGGRSWFIDPAYNGRGVTQHLSYYADTLPAGQEPFDEKELVEEGKKHIESAEAKDTGARAGEAAGAEVALRTYRLGLVTDPNYAEYFDDNDPATAPSPVVTMAERATLVNRVNKVYNDDLAVRMVMADGSENLNLDTEAEATEPDGPCGENACYPDNSDGTNPLDSCSGELLDRNRFVVGQIIGADNYDIGHIALGGGGGGVAYLGVVGEEDKAGGCTGLETPDGDFFAIDYVAHEMGHQFNGEHTFNGANGSCAPPNRWGPSAVEPGSGSSVMAYAGICFTDNLQPHSDPYFSQQSIDEVTEHVTGDPTNYEEIQTVTLRDFDTNGDSFTVTFPTTGESTTFTRGTDYDHATVQTRMADITNTAVTVSGYDGEEEADDKGFTVTWPNTTDNPPRFVLSSFTGATGFVGVDVQGGPSTNQGITADPSGNHAPSVTAPADKTIPQRTPFMLSAQGEDVDGDALVYLWEQDDPGLYLTGLEPGEPLNEPDRVTGPLFRIFGDDAQVTDDEALEYEAEGENLADGNPTRSFPDMAQIVANNTNAESPCEPQPPASPTSQFPDPYLDCVSELLPSFGYNSNPIINDPGLNFRVTARDLDPAGGGTQHDDVRLTVGSAGPFLVSSRETAGDPASGGASEVVTWDVAGTNSATYATNVRISLSINGGLTFPTVLAASTPNDGTETVTLPLVNTAKARIKVEAVDNYFFDVNNADFAIESPTTGTPTPNTAPVARAKASKKVVVIGQVLRLNAKDSLDIETPSNGLTYEWDFGNRGRKVDATGPVARAKYGKRGFRTITLTVTDPQGLEDTKKLPIQVLRRKDCEDPGVQRTDGWRTASRKSALGGRYCTTDAGAGEQRMRTAFSGDSLRIYFGKARAGGTATVFVDDRRVGTLSFDGKKARPRFNRSKAFSGFGKGGHFVRIEVNGGAAYVDTFAY